ncbi:MAG: terminase small subunit [Candidatus Moranbacteria bacterium]|nr:terminase small subunit [Candidatus Moranbacteria bacterium]
MATTPRKSATKDRQLNPKQTTFCQEYLVDLNAKQAAIRAGYSQKTAEVIGYQLLQNTLVAGKLQELRTKQEVRTGISADRALKEAARLAFFDVRKLCDAQGNPIRVQELDDDTAAAIQGLELVSEKDGEGFATVRKYKVADKNAALERVFKHLGLFERDNEQSNPAKAMNKLMELVGGSKLPISTAKK